MKRSRSKSLLAVLTATLVFGAVQAFGMNGDEIWQPIDSSQVGRSAAEQQGLPNNFAAFSLNKKALSQLLAQAPEEYTGRQKAVLTLPLPDGTLGRFAVEHSLVVEPGLLKNYPELGATYRGQGIDDPTASVRFDLLPSGFHAFIISSTGSVIVDPVEISKGDIYISYNKGDRSVRPDFACNVGGTDRGFRSLGKVSQRNSADFVPDAAPELTSGTQLRTYRLALAATGEYSAVFGGTVAGALAAQVLIMNRVNGVYERDVAIHMNIIANNNSLIYTNAASDPYTNDDGETMLDENQANLDLVIGTGNYDIGHVFSTGGGGIAGLRVPCVGGQKAWGVTGLPSPIGDDFAIDFVAHEMGHQFGANHTFNTSCGGNRSSSSAYEPGSGISIMGYAGVCGAQDLALHSIDTFHYRSLSEIITYTTTGTGNTCAVTTSTGNTPPAVPTVGGPYNIPAQTPFSLSATTTDSNGDALTYDWLEYDLGAATSAIPNTDASGGARPIFRPYLPNTTGVRYFPSLVYILNSANVPPSTYNCSGFACLTGELMPTITRTMLFQVVARDNRANGGGINTNSVTVNVTSTAGPFAVTAPNTAVTFNGGSTQTVTWNVANTTASPVSAANVDILLSTDGGQTYPTVLLAATPNDGSQTVTIPNIGTTAARIMVRGSGNIFFDVSNANFTINASSASISGRVFGQSGRGVKFASVLLTVSGGSSTVYTDSRGFYTFTGIPTGSTYTVKPTNRRFNYTPQTFTLSGNLTNVDFTPTP